MTGIIVSVGPTTNNKDKLLKLYENGVRILRFNFSHRKHEDTKKLIDEIRELEKELAGNFCLLGDLRGPGIRTGDLKEPVTYKYDETFKIVNKKKLVDNPKTIYCDYIRLIRDIEVNNKIVIDSGLFEVKVIEKHKNHIIVKALNSATITSKRHINLPGLSIKLPSLTDKDKEDIVFCIKNHFDYMALSFVRKKEDIIELKKYLNSNKSFSMKIIAKIENQEGINNISDIINVSDSIMIARGDLGAELPIENIPDHQMRIIKKTKSKSKKVIVATQMLESMISNPIPTRAEISDIFYAVLQGADYLMLSGETSIGKHPVKCVKIMNKVIAEAQKYI
ncbi:pyruvate kinase [Candidatus Gracilibacteria bacterium]|nr:pyruvate kinase [Candidatus Gracilibacteria bacterium]